MSTLTTAYLVAHDVKDKSAFNITGNYQLKYKRNFNGKRVDYCFTDGSILSVYPMTQKLITRNTQGEERFTYPMKTNKLGSN